MGKIRITILKNMFAFLLLNENAVSVEQPPSWLIPDEPVGEETSLVYSNVPRWKLTDTNGGAA